MTTPIDTKNQDAAELVGLDDAPEFYDEAKRIQKPYGLKRHDEICDHLEQVQRMSEADVVTASVGIWMGIESERQHKNKQITALREENERLKAEHEKFCIGAQQKTDADFKVTREAAERAREQLSVEREKSKKLVEALVWCDEMLTARDQMNCKVHCAPVRLSPITERVKMALAYHAESEKHENT